MTRQAISSISAALMTLMPTPGLSEDLAYVVGGRLWEVIGDRGHYGYILTKGAAAMVKFQPCGGTPYSIERKRLRPTGAKCSDSTPPDMNPLKFTCADPKYSWANAIDQVQALADKEKADVGAAWKFTGGGSTPQPIAEMQLFGVLNEAAGIKNCGPNDVVFNKSGDPIAVMVMPSTIEPDLQ